MSLRRALQLLPIALIGLTTSQAVANSQSYDAWLSDLRQQAAREGVDTRTLDEALDGISFQERVIELDRKQPESTKTFQQYIKNVVNEARINRAIDEFESHRQTLEATSKQYGVQPEYIVALWAIESNFGERMGTFNVVEALATLAYDGRRSAYFRGELLNALKIIDAGHISAADMLGSWAGAMGQCQFMPTSFLSYAVDADGDGKKNIWQDEQDVFASIANYLSSVGWNEEVYSSMKISATSKQYRAYKQKKLTLDGWRKLGIAHTQYDESTAQYNLMSGNSNGSGPYYLVSENYYNILKWNRSRYFALAVGSLAESIRQGVSGQ